jgi:uncharacterized protein (DUF983 family)
MIYACLTLKCPRCRKGNMFVNANPYNLKKLTHMHQKCSSCGLDYVREPSFYFGAMYVSYALTIAYGVGCFIVFKLLAGFSLMWYLILNALVLLMLIPYTFRLARTLWITIMVKYEPNSDKSNETQIK